MMHALWNKAAGLLFVALLMGVLPAIAQTASSDEELIEGQDLHDTRFDPIKVHFTGDTSKSILARYNPVSLALGGLMLGYQKIISPQISAECMYSPSCSRFSQALIKEFGFIKGVFLSADRLMRCNQLGGLDVHHSRWDRSTGKARENPLRFRVRPRKHQHSEDEDHLHTHR